jgi:glycosyltransferase involved in cell wall biosynthesis
VLKDARGETPSRQDATTSGDAQAMAEAISETHAMLRRLAEEFEMPGQLRLIPGRMTPSQYAACDLFVVMDDQSVSLDALLEAQSMEVPVIATDETLTAEMIEDGTTGRLVDFDDVAAVSSALNGLLDDTRAARAMAIAGRLRVCQQFDENERDQRVARCYQRVMAEA